MPAGLTNLTQLWDGLGLDLRWNALFQSDPAVVAFLNRKQLDGPDWRNAQTIAPHGLRAEAVGPEAVRLSWQPIRFSEGAGFYRVFRSTSPAGPFAAVVQTANKRATGFTVTDLLPGVSHYFRVRTVTPPHADNANQVVSLPGGVVRTSTPGGP